MLESPFMKENVVDPIRIIETPKLQGKIFSFQKDLSQNQKAKNEKLVISSAKMFLPL